MEWVGIAIAILCIGGVLGIIILNSIHRHKWETVSKTFAPPQTEAEIIGRGVRAHELIRQLSFGVTTRVQKCSDCGKERSYETIGDTR